MDSTGRKRRLKELLDMGGKIRLTQGVEDNVVTIQKISKIVQETDKINTDGEVKDRANNTTEVVMDAQIIQMSHELISEVMQKMGNSEFSEDEWCNAINCFVNKGSNECWDSLAEQSSNVSRIFKCTPCFFGGFDLQPDIRENLRKERQRRSKNQQESELQPSQLKQSHKHDGNSHNIVTVIYKQIIKLYLINKVPIPYYKLIIDPDNFMQTIDNAFKVAFLVRDKSVLVEIGDDNLPNIMPLNKQDQVNSSNGTVQAIGTINPEIYKLMIKKYKIKTAMLNQKD